MITANEAYEKSRAKYLESLKSRTDNYMKAIIDDIEQAIAEGRYCISYPLTNAEFDAMQDFWQKLRGLGYEVKNSMDTYRTYIKWAKENK